MIDTDKYEGHTEGIWTLGKHKGFPSIFAVEDVETPTWVKNIARGLSLNEVADHALLLDAPLLLAEIKRIQQDTLKVVSDWFDSDENEWRRLEQALGLPLTPLSWEGGEE